MSELLRLPEVLKRTGLKRSTIYQMASNGTFPRPIKLTARASAWDLKELNQWIESKRQERDQAA